MPPLVKKRIAVIGAGLCGSVLSALLRTRYDVTVIEQGRQARPLFNDIDCDLGEVNGSINRAEGLGGTTNYWHNALIELAPDDLRKAGIRSGSLEPYYTQAWRFFFSDEELQDCNRQRDANDATLARHGCEVAHMVIPRRRSNAWTLAHSRYPGADVRVVYGRARQIVPPAGQAPGHVVVDTDAGATTVEADCVLVCTGGLGTPILLSRSIPGASAFCPGYHDHPTVYVAKIRIRPESILKPVSCTTTQTGEVRAGLVYQHDGRKTVVYLRPALNLSVRSIQGSARFVLSDVRNDPFSPKKILQLLTNLEAIREALLFKMQSGFTGDYYSLLIFGEQTPVDTRGVSVEPGRTPRLNWHVTDEERLAYQRGVEQFLDDFRDDILESNVIPAAAWEFRTGAHHSGSAFPFLQDPGEPNLDYFAVNGLPGTFVCDGSLLRAAGIANSGLTLVALSLRLAELLSAESNLPSVTGVAS